MWLAQVTVLDIYPWLKGLHVAAAILFVGGVLSATAFLSSQAGGELSPEQRRAVIAFRRWDSLLTTPAMLLVWALGLTLALSAGWFHSGWLPAKLVFVLLLSALHGIQSGTLRRLAGGQGSIRPQQGAILAILASTTCIAVLAVVKPF